MRRLGLGFVLLLAVPAATASCGFDYDPASIPKYYRANGWALPGIADSNASAKVQTEGLPMPREPISGAIASILPHDDSPYIVEFPAQEFMLNGAMQRMRPVRLKATIIRWSVNGQVVAYSYGLVPIVAHRERGKWVVDSEAGCVFAATFIDDKGDGVFRILIPASFRADLVPSWAKQEKD
jgi:hypothetical protein